MIKIADKFRRTFPIAVNFTDGELPSAKKMNGLAGQARSSTGVLEYAIGDIWNQAGDGVIGQDDSSVILTPSLGRAIGGVRKLSPRIPALANIEEYTHVLYDDCDAVHDLQLPFKPVVGTTFVFTGAWAANSASPKASKELVVANGDWYVNHDTGYLYSFLEAESRDTITYEPVIPGDLGADATFNMIPDEDTVSSYAFRGLKVEFTNGSNGDDGYDVYLPPRGPLDTRAIELAAPPISDATDAITTENYQVAPLGTNPRRFWQADTEDADISANASHYRYELPKILTNNWSSGAVIPAGFMYLYDPNSRSILEGITMTAEAAGTPKTWFFHASGTALDTWLATTTGATKYSSANLKKPGHEASLYPALGLRVICIGVPLSDSFSSFLVQFLNHDHGMDHYERDTILSSKAIKHSNLLGLDEAGLHVPQLPSSQWSGDDHNQYVHRWGMDSGRDKYYGGMFGDLLFLSTDSDCDYQNFLADSNGIRFGHATDGPVISYSSTQQALNFSPGAIASGIMMTHEGLSPNPRLEINFPLDGTTATELKTTNGYLKLSTVNEVLSDSYAWLFTDPGTGNYGDAGDAALVVAAKTATDDDAIGQNGFIMANRQFAGPHSDTTYGWSASSASNAKYGPLRSHLVSAMDWVTITTQSDFSTGATFTELAQNLFTAPDTGVDTDGSASNLTIPLKYWQTTDQPGETNYMFAKIDLPYQKWSIVNAYIKFRNRSVVTLTAGINYFTVGKYNSVISTSETVDLQGVFGAGPANGSYDGDLVFAVSTTTSLIEITKNFSSTSEFAFCRFKGVGSAADFISWDIESVNIIYRIWEF